jgi:hypothetical protein
MTRQTSIEAYNKIRDEGLLGHLQFAVYAVLWERGPMTQGELWHDHFPNAQRHSIAPRFAELHKRGVIAPVGERPCRVTGVNSLLWDVTAMLPQDPPPSQKGLKDRVASLEKAVNQLYEMVLKAQGPKYDAGGQSMFDL